jgi:hypothetical protein
MKIQKSFKIEETLVNELEILSEEKNLDMTKTLEYVLLSYFAVKGKNSDYSKNALKLIIDKI